MDYNTEVMGAVALKTTKIFVVVLAAFIAGDLARAQDEPAAESQGGVQQYMAKLQSAIAANPIKRTGEGAGLDQVASFVTRLWEIKSAESCGMAKALRSVLIGHGVLVEFEGKESSSSMTDMQRMLMASVAFQVLEWCCVPELSVGVKEPDQFRSELVVEVAKVCPIASVRVKAALLLAKPLFNDPMGDGKRLDFVISPNEAKEVFGYAIQGMFDVRSEKWSEDSAVSYVSFVMGNGLDYWVRLNLMISEMPTGDEAAGLIKQFFELADKASTTNPPMGVELYAQSFQSKIKDQMLAASGKYAEYFADYKDIVPIVHKYIIACAGNDRAAIHGLVSENVFRRIGPKASLNEMFPPEFKDVQVVRVVPLGDRDGKRAVSVLLAITTQAGDRHRVVLELTLSKTPNGFCIDT